MTEQERSSGQERRFRHFLIWCFVVVFICVILPSLFCIWLFYYEDFGTWWAEREANRWLDETYPLIVNATDDTPLPGWEEPKIRKGGTMVCVGGDARLYFSTDRSFDEVVEDYSQVFGEDWHIKTLEWGAEIFYIPDNKYIRAVIIGPSENSSVEDDTGYQVRLWFDECRCSEGRDLVCS